MCSGPRRHRCYGKEAAIGGRWRWNSVACSKAWPTRMTAGLVERLADDLEGERQPVLEADRHRQRRRSGQVVGTGIGGALEGRIGRDRVDARRRAGRVGRDDDIDAVERVGEFDAQLAPLAHRLDIIGRGQKRAEPDPREHVVAEILRPLAEILFVQRIGLGQHDQPVGVEHSRSAATIADRRAARRGSPTSGRQRRTPRHRRRSARCRRRNRRPRRARGNGGRRRSGARRAAASAPRGNPAPAHRPRPGRADRSRPAPAS